MKCETCGNPCPIHIFRGSTKPPENKIFAIQDPQQRSTYFVGHPNYSQPTDKYFCSVLCSFTWYNKHTYGKAE